MLFYLFGSSWRRWQVLNDTEIVNETCGSFLRLGDGGWPWENSNTEATGVRYPQPTLFGGVAVDVWVWRGWFIKSLWSLQVSWTSDLIFFIVCVYMSAWSLTCLSGFVDPEVLTLPASWPHVNMSCVFHHVVSASQMSRRFLVSRSVTHSDTPRPGSPRDTQTLQVHSISSSISLGIQSYRTSGLVHHSASVLTVPDVRYDWIPIGYLPHGFRVQ